MLSYARRQNHDCPQSEHRWDTRAEKGLAVVSQKAPLNPSEGTAADHNDPEELMQTKM